MYVCAIIFVQCLTENHVIMHLLLPVICIKGLFGIKISTALTENRPQIIAVNNPSEGENANE